MHYLLIDPYRQTAETVNMVRDYKPDPAHPAARHVIELLDSRHTDLQMLPDGDTIMFHLDDLLTPSPDGAMVQGCLTFGYALVVPARFASGLRVDADTLTEQTVWINTTEQARAAVQSIHF